MAQPPQEPPVQWLQAITGGTCFLSSQVPSTLTDPGLEDIWDFSVT